MNDTIKMVLHCGKRSVELDEDTLYNTGALRALADYFVKAADQNKAANHYWMEVFIGLADLSSVDGIHGIDHEGEDIRPFSLPLREAYEMIETGTVNNAMSIIALQWLMLNKQKVLDKWS